MLYLFSKATLIHFEMKNKNNPLQKFTILTAGIFFSVVLAVVVYSGIYIARDLYIAFADLDYADDVSTIEARLVNVERIEETGITSEYRRNKFELDIHVEDRDLTLRTAPLMKNHVDDIKIIQNLIELQPGDRLYINVYTQHLEANTNLFNRLVVLGQFSKRVTPITISIKQGENLNEIYQYSAADIEASIYNQIGLPILGLSILLAGAAVGILLRKWLNSTMN